MQKGYIDLQEMMLELLNKMGYPREIYELLKEPTKSIKVRIPVRMDDDSIKIFTGYRTKHHNVFGITQGNVHFRPDLTEEEISQLAILRSVKTSNMQIPLGGSSGGVICDVRELSFRELERVCRGYIRAIQTVIGPDMDVLSSDASIDPQIMAWMMDEYSQLNTQANPNFITGKPVVLGGIKNKDTAIEKGILSTIQSLLQDDKKKHQEQGIMIHGIGRIGSYLATSLHRLGYKIIGISDPQGAVYNSAGLEVPNILKKKDNFGLVTKSIPESIDLDSFLQKECHMMVLTAKGEQITNKSASQINANLLLESIANSIEKSALEVLFEKQVSVIPEVITTTGGIIYAYLEWLEYKQGIKYTAEEVDKRLHNIINEAIREVRYISENKHVNMYMASYMVGLKNQAEAIRFRGWI
ncbi:Glu/Leu/Phe/Val family dehydrogenase [Gracilibacillus kekensis]|uniref:Glutamate dehydrogenase n=1 Tax=Gracilibacillus kekensis TaxID=1027249 RepID=A0A1M7PRD9_9BACI|nr:Glu/Leu/Phe/Val dehydrogenase [Gracilibacillus kekensis]SHN19957.1 glutamate dehydrogenase (NAD) [Gracilibacillus kekensis]